MKCDCERFGDGIALIGGLTKLAIVHGIEFPEEYKFDYCPWCGRRLLPTDKDFDRYDEETHSEMIT